MELHFEVINLVGSNQGNKSNNEIPYSKHMLKEHITVSLKVRIEALFSVLNVVVVVVVVAAAAERKGLTPQEHETSREEEDK